MKKIITCILVILIFLSGCNLGIGSVQGENTKADTVLDIAQKPTKIELILEKMSLEEKIGQLFLARCPQTDAEKDIKTYNLGGYVLFEIDFKNKTANEIKNNIKGYQQSSKIPLFIAVDEEGGGVCRVSKNTQLRKEPFLSMRQLFELDGINAVLAEETKKISFLQSFGINVNLGPVCDITDDPEGFMYERSLGESPDVTGDLISKTVKLYNKEQFGGVLKHFPGYANNADTHIGIAIDNRDIKTLKNRDFIPFIRGIQSDAKAIMMSHIILEAIDKEYPASLSKKVIDYLREEINFSGVIITDDLSMQAVTDRYGAEQSAIMAILAGNDILCSTDYKIQYNALLKAVKDGKITKERIDCSVIKIIEWKYSLGMLQNN